MESTFNLDEIKWFMQEAEKEALKASDQGEVPVGAVIVTSNKEVIGMGHNDKEFTKNPCGHAEVNAIIDASKTVGDWRLNGSSIFVNLEPCIMCMGSIVHARLDNVFFGAYDKKGGAISLGYQLFNDKRLNHNFNIYGGINHFQNSKLLSDFFRSRRKAHSK